MASALCTGIRLPPGPWTPSGQCDVVSCCFYAIFPSPPQLTCVILGVLRFNPHGPPYFVFNRDGSLRWPQGAVISEVWLEGSLQAFSNQSLAIVGDNDQQVKQHSSARSTLPRLDSWLCFWQRVVLPFFCLATLWQFTIRLSNIGSERG